MPCRCECPACGASLTLTWAAGEPALEPPAAKPCGDCIIPMVLRTKDRAEALRLLELLVKHNEISFHDLRSVPEPGKPVP